MAETTLFCTRALAPEKRLAAWTQSIGVIFDTGPDETRRPAHFHGRVETVMLDGLLLNRCASHAQAFNRSVARYAGDGLDHYMLQVFLSGEVDVARGDARVQAGQGALICFDLAETLNSFNTEFDLLNVFIPRRRLSGLLKNPDSLHGLAVDAESGTGRLLADYIVSLYRSGPGLSAVEETVAAGVLIQLAANAFNGVTLPETGPPDWADHALVLKARTVMRDFLDDPALGPDLIAGHMGISRARLYRAFNGIGGVHAIIREMRLRRCFADLSSPAHAGLTIAGIAYRWGFSDPAHFTRAFRARFGMTPGEARQRENLTRLGASGPDGLDRTYEAWIAAMG